MRAVFSFLNEKKVTPTAHGLFTDGGQKSPPPQNLPHISCNDEKNM